MNPIPKELTSKFLTPIPYSMGTGSSDWVGIKINFETLNEEVMTLIFAYDQGKEVTRNQLEDAKINSNNFRNIVFEYDPKNLDESQEQDLLLEKVKEAIAIYDWMWEKIM